MSFFRKIKENKNARTTASAVAWTAGGTLRIILKVLMTTFLIILTTSMIFACIFAVYVKTCLSTDLTVTIEDFTLNLSSTMWYQDKNGGYQELASLHGAENRQWVDYNEIPQNLIHASVAIEDKRFFDHKGVDWYRSVAAFGNMFISMKNDFGGSTITQQLIKNITQEDDITVQRKLLEIFRALELEKNYSKDDIIMWYLNVIYLGNGCYGVGAASEMYFGKDVSELTLAECASLIGITNNPSRFSPYADIAANKERQETILREMYEQGFIDSYEEYETAVKQELKFVRNVNENNNQDIYSYYVETVVNDVLEDLVNEKGISLQSAKQLLYSGGYQVYTCIDVDIQNQVDSIYKNMDNLPKAWKQSQQQFESAIVIMDHHTGEIVALCGGTGEKKGNFVLNRIDSKRPPGSSFKPVAVYGPAFDVGLITQYTKVDDAADIKLSGTTWFPKNAGGGYRGITTIRQGVISSLNTVAAQTVDKLSLQTSYDYLTKKLGFELEESDLNYAPLALGQLSHGTTVRNMAQAYTSFANEGIMTYGRTYSKVLDADGNVVLENEPVTANAFKPNTAYNITNMLQGAVSYGTGTAASLGFMPVAGKTGTTSNDCDRYFVGYTPYYVAAVWTGYDTPEAMRFTSNPAAQIWKSIMGPIHENLAPVDFPKPKIGAPTNIFGDLEEEESPEPEESVTPSESPLESETPPPSDSSPTPTPTYGMHVGPGTGSDIPLP